jgi:VPDSG-CTERM motif/PEP-CTERM motif
MKTIHYSTLAALALLGVATSQAGSTASQIGLSSSFTVNGETFMFEGSARLDPYDQVQEAAVGYKGGALFSGGSGGSAGGITVDSNMNGDTDPLMFFSGNASNGTPGPVGYGFSFFAPIVVPIGTTHLAISLSYGQTLSDGTGGGATATPTGVFTAGGGVGFVDYVFAGTAIVNPASGFPDTVSTSFPTVSTTIPYSGEVVMNVDLGFTLSGFASSGFSGTLLVTPITKVPDAGSSLMLLGFGLVGVAALRRKLS